MKVTGLDGREYRLCLSGKRPQEDDSRPRSSYHFLARCLLRELFPNDHLLEEVHLPGCTTDLYVDFFLRLRGIMVEVQGEQHYRMVRFFQSDRLDFLRGKGRDLDKRRWCQTNGISLVELPYTEDEHAWRRRILDAHRPEVPNPL